MASTRYSLPSLFLAVKTLAFLARGCENIIGVGQSFAHRLFITFTVTEKWRKGGETRIPVTFPRVADRLGACARRSRANALSGNPTLTVAFRNVRFTCAP